MFETLAKTIIGLERLMLESSGFDFRNRQPQKLLLKFAKHYSLTRDPISRTAYHMSLDLYRTFAPLKQSSATMALACLELAIRMHNEDPAQVYGAQGPDYARWHTSRVEVMGACSSYPSITCPTYL
jgi:CTD kinase subunit beta